MKNVSEVNIYNEYWKLVDSIFKLVSKGEYFSAIQVLRDYETRLIKCIGFIQL